MKEIRREAVHLFTGVGSVAGKDGIFSREQKWAANRASGLSQDALDLQMKESKRPGAAGQMQVDESMMDGAEEAGDLQVDQRRATLLAQSLIDPFAPVDS